MSSSRLKRLKCLVDELSDRDRQLKSDSGMFVDFFQNFPIPVTMWSLDESGNILAKRGNAVVKEAGATCLGNMFLDDYSDEFKEAHKKAYEGQNVEFFSDLTDKVYYTRLVPRKSDDEIIGLTGISWDITSNFKILQSLKSIIELCDNENSGKEDIKKIAQESINISRIKKLLGD